jgi:hypothetical protein
LTPSQYWACDTNNNFVCLFEEDREEMQKHVAEERSAGGITLHPWQPDLSLAEPLTPAERLECENTGHEPLQTEDKDKDTKDDE